MNFIKSRIISLLFLDKPLLAVLSAVTLGVLISTMLSYFYTMNAVEELAKNQTTVSLGFLDHEIIDSAREMNYHLELISQMDVIRFSLEKSYLGLSARKAAERMLTARAKNGIFDRLFLAAPNGEILISSTPSLYEKGNVSDMQYFIQAMSGRPSQQTLAPGRFSGQNILILAMPALGPQKEVLGVLCAVISIQSLLSQTLDSLKIGSSGGAYVMDSQVQILARPTWARPGDFEPGSSAPAVVKAAQNKTVLRYPGENQERICVASVNKYTGWVLVIEGDAEEILRPANQLTALNGIVSLGTLSLVVLALGVLRRVMRDLKDSESSYRALTELSPVGIVTFDEKLKPTYMNSQARRILGLGQSLAPPDDIPMEDAAELPLKGQRSPLLNVLDKGETLSGISIWHRMPDNSRKALFLNAAPLRKQGQGIQGVVATLEDVTDRLLGQLALKESEEKFRSIVESLPLGLHFYKLDNANQLIISDANPTADLLFGLKHSVLMGKRLEEAFPKLKGSKEVELYKKIALGEAGRNNFEYVYQGGITSRVFEVINFRCGPRAMAAAFIDITERKKNEENLRFSEDRFSRLFRLSPEPIALLNAETQDFADVNDAFCELTGYASGELIGKHPQEFELFSDIKSFENLLGKIEEDGHVENFEFEGLRKDRRAISCSASCTCLEIGKQKFYLGMIRDITEIKKMQEMMIQTEKMISIGGIAAGIAHEINNPLGIVLQAAQNLVQRTRPDFRKNLDVAAKLGLDMNIFERYLRERKLDVFIQDIQAAAMRASGIIRHMLDFSRRSESRRKVCDVYGIINRAITLAGSDFDLKKSYDFKRIKIELDFDENLPVINCTETEIEQVILNLLRNSAQALASLQPPKDDPCIRITVKGEPGLVGIEIADNGPGVPTEMQRRVFEPFFTTKPPGVGTGLGLSVSYFIVTKGHGGKMTLVSPSEGGSLFRIELPTDRAREDLGG